MNEISKSVFRAKVLEVLRSVEETGQSVLITDKGKPTVEIRRYRYEMRNPKDILKGSVLAFVSPTDPTGDQWESL